MAASQAKTFWERPRKFRSIPTRPVTENSKKIHHWDFYSSQNRLGKTAEEGK